MCLPNPQQAAIFVILAVLLQKLCLAVMELSENCGAGLGVSI